MAERAAGLGPDDAVVVLARGAGRRFGGAKPLAVVGGDARPLVRRVVDLYAAWPGATVLVVTTAELRATCEAALAGGRAATVLPGPGGGDTARTLGLAAAWLAARAPDCRRVWAHPVDVPRVAGRTLAQLAHVSAATPGRVVRPAWGGQPGHPVVVPAPLLAALAEPARAAEGPWRDVLAAAVAAGRAPAELRVPVADPGVVLDHDRPEQGANDGSRGDDA